MKTLIFTLLFSFQALAAGNPNELSDQEIRQKMISVAKDIENEKILEGVTELQDCKKGFNPTAGQDNSAALKQLQTCIQDKFKGRSAEEIKAISDKLSLEAFNLIPSKTVNNVTDYLSKKLYKNLTGVDLDEQDQAQRIKNLKFGVKKQIDQKAFFDLYKNQVAKNVIYEISRFCFLEFRRSGGSQDNFMNHWNDLNDFDNPVSIDPIPRTIGAVDDTGSPFTEGQSNTTQNGQIAASTYQDIFKGIFGYNTTPPKPERLDNFFKFCGQNINLLCSNFEKNKVGDPEGRSTTPAQNASVPGPSTAVGARACITKSRLISYKTAFAAADKIYDEFSKDSNPNIGLLLDKNEMVNRYARGNGANEKSLADLTNTASYDFFKATENENNSEAEECANNGDDSACEKFIVIGDSRENIQNNTDLVYLAKKEAERARVRALVQAGGQPLDEYLETNYPDLKAEIDKDPSQKSKLEEKVAARWEAKRLAMQQEIVNRIGKRQITQAEAGASGNSQGQLPTQAKALAQENAKEAMNEKARLAQVVFFNNIIASSLELKKISGESLGRNVGAINNEIAAAGNEAQSDLFDNLQSTLGKNQGGNGGGQLTGSETITNIDFLNDFIGIPNDQKKAN